MDTVGSCLGKDSIDRTGKTNDSSETAERPAMGKVLAYNQTGIQILSENQTEDCPQNQKMENVRISGENQSG